MLRRKPIIPGVRTLISIGYKYNTRKVLYFIVTDNAGITQAGITYLSKYPDQFTNVDIRPVACPLVMYKFFGVVNEVDSRNKSRQYGLALENFRVTQCGWLWSFNTVYMVMTITNCWKLFHCGIKRDLYEKLIGIRELSEGISEYCFNNIFQLILGPWQRTKLPLIS